MASAGRGTSSPETVEQVFWRMVKEGVPSDEIGRHPDYQAAVKRECETHAEGCATRDNILRACSCGAA